jgi:hypothetical protein
MIHVHLAVTRSIVDTKVNGDSLRLICLFMAAQKATIHHKVDQPVLYGILAVIYGICLMSVSL